MNYSYVQISLEHKVIKTSNGLQITGLGFGSYGKGPLIMSNISYRVTLVVTGHSGHSGQDMLQPFQGNWGLVAF